MPPRRLVLAFITLWYVLGVVLLVGSVRAMLGGLHGAHGPGGVHLALLGGAEAIAAGLFLIPGTMKTGAIGLLVTIGVAIAAHALAGEFPMQLLLYAAGVVFVLVHGPVPLKSISGPSDSAHA